MYAQEKADVELAVLRFAENVKKSHKKPVIEI